MIIEQAFIALPELLLGNHYAVQDYEAGIVGVLSMAILQELNGRNAVHPIQHLQAERRYNPASPRRADLYVNVRRLMVTNRKLGNYGWRHHNWVEAKFYRNKSHIQRHATNKATYQGQLIADLIRLTCLVPLTLGDRDSNGRYFLHVYDDEPKYYLAYQDRAWVRALHQAGRQDIVIDQLTEESGTAKSQSVFRRPACRRAMRGPRNHGLATGSGSRRGRAGPRAPQEQTKSFRGGPANP